MPADTKDLPTEVSEDRFFVDPRSGNYSTEASDLGWSPGFVPKELLFRTKYGHTYQYRREPSRDTQRFVYRLLGASAGPASQVTIYND